MTIRLDPGEGAALWSVLLLAVASSDPLPGARDPYAIHREIRSAAGLLQPLLIARLHGRDRSEEDLRSLGEVRRIAARFGIIELTPDPLSQPPARLPHGGPLLLEDDVAVACIAVLGGVARGEGAARDASVPARWLVEQGLTDPVPGRPAAHEAEERELERLHLKDLRAFVRRYGLPAERRRSSPAPAKPRNPAMDALRRLWNGAAGPRR